MIERCVHDGGRVVLGFAEVDRDKRGRGLRPTRRVGRERRPVLSASGNGGECAQPSVVRRGDDTGVTEHLVDDGHVPVFVVGSFILRLGLPHPLCDDVVHRLLRELPFCLVVVGFALVLRAEERVGVRPLVRVLPKLGFREGGRHRDIGLRSLAYDTGDFLPTPRGVVVEVLAVRPLAEDVRDM